ncbi:hypothetical protein [Devosia sp.]|uniref:hypothetical protein n=1 Tax=Devosia sp. TaxID=1871048 RepID=UPI00326711B6
MRTKILAVATAALLAFSLAAHAAEAVPVDPEGDQVSDAVDIAMFCGAAFTVASMSDQVTADEKAASEQMATMSFARAKTALDADGVAETEYDRLTKFYVDAAIADMSAGTENMRYSSDECVAEAQK